MQKVTLGDVCEILDNQRVPITASERKSGPYPYYGANGLQDYVDGYIFDDDLVLLAEDGGNFGSKDKPIAYRVSGKCWVNNHAHVLKPKDNIDVNYLCYSLMFYNVDGLVNGATRQKLTQKDMRKISIPLPLIEEQKAIAEKLDKVSSLIEKRKQQLSVLDTLVQSKFVEMFGDLRNNSKQWSFTPLSMMCDVRDGTHDSPKYCSEGYPLMTSKNFSNGEVDFTDVNLISQKDFDLINKRSKVDIGDVIMPMIGTIGHPVIVNTDKPFAIKNVALIKFNLSKVSNIFIKAILDSDYFATIIEEKNRGNTQKFIALGDIRNVGIPNVPIDMQNKFADFVKQTEKTKAKIKQSLAALELLKKSLMQKYFG